MSKLTNPQRAAIVLALQIAGQHSKDESILDRSDYWDRGNKIEGIEHLALMLDCWHIDIAEIRRACKGIYFTLTRRALTDRIETGKASITEQIHG